MAGEETSDPSAPADNEPKLELPATEVPVEQAADPVVTSDVPDSQKKNPLILAAERGVANAQADLDKDPTNKAVQEELATRQRNLDQLVKAANNP